LKTVDGIFTDPPYFDNVQYAELMDFCYAWLRLLLGKEIPEFEGRATGTERELTGNKTTGKGLEHFANGLSRVFQASASLLRPGAPFVFTYHHNDIAAYVPIVVALLDAGLVCTATLPSPAEMTASLHINGTGSSSVDSVIVSRRDVPPLNVLDFDAQALEAALISDKRGLWTGGVRCTEGDLACLAMGHLARVTSNKLHGEWRVSTPLAQRLGIVDALLRELHASCDASGAIDRVARSTQNSPNDGLLPFSVVLE
jgi:hypothetical protein